MPCFYCKTFSIIQINGGVVFQRGLDFMEFLEFELKVEFLALLHNGFIWLLLNLAKTSAE